MKAPADDGKVGAAILRASAGVILHTWDESRRVALEVDGDPAFDQVVVIGVHADVARASGAPCPRAPDADMAARACSREGLVARSPAGGAVASGFAAPAAADELLVMVILRGRCYPLRLARPLMEAMAEAARGQVEILSTQVTRRGGEA